LVETTLGGGSRLASSAEPVFSSCGSFIDSSYIVSKVEPDRVISASIDSEAVFVRQHIETTAVFVEREPTEPLLQPDPVGAAPIVVSLFNLALRQQRWDPGHHLVNRAREPKLCGHSQELVDRGISIGVETFMCGCVFATPSQLGFETNACS